MIRRIIPLPTQPQLSTYIDVPLLIHLPLPLDHPHTLLIPLLPRCSAIHARDLNPTSASPRPLLETVFVDVVAAGRAAPDDLFSGRDEFGEADRAVAGDGFAV